MTELTGAVVLHAGEGKTVHFGLITSTMKAGEDAAGGGYGFVEQSHGPKSGGPPLHTHPHNEAFYVLAGNMTFQAGNNIVEAAPGTFVMVPGGLPHTFSNRSDAEVKMLILFAPAGFERYFEEIAQAVPPGQRPDPEIVRPIMARYGQEVVGPPIPLGGADA